VNKQDISSLYKLEDVRAKSRVDSKARSKSRAKSKARARSRLMRKARVTFSLQFASHTSSTAVEMSARQLLLQKCWLGWEPMNFDQ